MRRYSSHVFAYEPMPGLAESLRREIRARGVTIESVALSDRTGTAELRMPVVDGVVVTGCSTVSLNASATYPGYRGIEVPMERLDNVYRGHAAIIKIDVEGHELAVLDGAVETVRRCRPRVLVELLETLAPGCVAQARAYFDRLGYRGILRPRRRDEADRAVLGCRDAEPVNLPDLTAPLQARQRFGGSSTISSSCRRRNRS